MNSVAPINPACLELEDAATYVGLRTTTWQELVRAGKAPPARELSARRVGWLVRELDQWLETRPVANMLPPPNTGAKKPRATPQESPSAAPAA